jgi:hypothetical protein
VWSDLEGDWSQLQNAWNAVANAAGVVDLADIQLCNAAQANETCRVQICHLPPTVPPPPLPPCFGSGCHNVQIVTSGDPNDKAGSQGAGPQQYISGATPLRYDIFFSNKETATAPAQDVVITDQLDVVHDDLSTFSFGPIAFTDQLVSPPAGRTDFTTTVDLQPANNLLVQVNAHLDVSTGLLTWRFTSLDPTTHQPPTDPSAGFLPPGGVGSVFFTVMPKQSLTTNTQIQNQATIVFDVNPPISTQTWLNTLDNDKPTSHVLPLPATQTSPNFTVQWSGSDVGSGVNDFTVFVSDNGSPFTPWQTNTTATSATYPGVAGHTYGFFSQARDLAGNVETLKTQAESTTTVVADTIPPTTTAVASPVPNTNGWNNTNVTVTLSAVDNPGGSGVKQIQFSLTGASSGTQTVPGSSAIVVIANEGVTTLTYSATDNAGNQETPKTLTVQIDKTPPAITALANPTTLWPPNGKMVPVTIAGAITDTVSGVQASTATYAVTDEYGSVQPSGKVTLGSNGSYSFTIQLQASRNGDDLDGRQYTITVSAQDNAGNTGTAATSVTVPHDQGQGKGM